MLGAVFLDEEDHFAVELGFDESGGVGGGELFEEGDGELGVVFFLIVS